MNIPSFYSLEEAASQIGKRPKWLAAWLLKNPMDPMGELFYWPVGRTKNFTSDNIAQIKSAIGDRSKVGFIYVVGFGDYLKIGFTKTIKKRFSAIQTSIPVPLVKHFTFRGSAEDEKRYHAQFAQFRLNGEWFRSDPSILKTMGDAAKMMNSFFGDDG